MNIFNRNIDLGLLILRLSVGALMLLHGLFKLVNGVGFVEGQLAEAGLPSFIAYGVYIGEVIAPLLIIAGFRARIAAAVLFFNCAVAALLTHSGDIFSLNEQGGWSIELLGLFMFGSAALIFTGAGKYAVSRKSIWD